MEQAENNPVFTADAASPEADDGSGVSWTASEFVVHDKSTGWYLALLLGTLLLAGLIFLVSRDPVSVGVVLVAGLLLGVYGSHKPRQIEYAVNRRGIRIGGKYRSYNEFRSFSVAPEGAFSSLVFMPLKRFAVPLVIYYAPDDEEKILSVLSEQLPLEEHRTDMIEGILRRIRF